MPFGNSKRRRGVCCLRWGANPCGGGRGGAPDRARSLRGACEVTDLAAFGPRHAPQPRAAARRAAPGTPPSAVRPRNPDSRAVTATHSNAEPFLNFVFSWPLWFMYLNVL